MRDSTPESERFWSKVDASGDCWLWIGWRNLDGYGRFWMVSGKNTPAHRYAYEALVGPIPDRLTIDHLCRNRACVNPDHLEPVTLRVNVLRGVSRNAINSRKTHCLRGHLLEGPNLIRDPRRKCRTCYNKQRKEHRSSRSKVA